VFLLSIDIGADVNMRDYDGRTALIAAVTRRTPVSVEFVAQLRAAGADVTAVDRRKRTAAHYVAEDMHKQRMVP